MENIFQVVSLDQLVYMYIKICWIWEFVQAIQVSIYGYF